MFSAVRRQVTRPLLAAVACVSLPAVANADTFAVTKAADTTIDSRGLVLNPASALYGIGINGNSFTNSAITTYNGWQYTAYWARAAANSNYVAVARRQVGTAAWQVANLTQSAFTDGLNSNDAHNVVSLGVDETDGTLHLSYDHHNSVLKYRVSNTGVATNPGAITSAQWSQSLFQTPRSWLVNSSSTISDVTYPHFIRKNNGGLQFTYRTGSSGNGSNWLVDYNAGAWSNLHQYDDGAVGTYYGTVTSGDTNRNSYINGATYGPSGRLYQSFTWREGATGAANHDIAFVYSDDNGNTWKNNAGTTVGTNTGLKWNLNTPGLTVVPIDEGQSLMNQQAQAVSGSTAATERFHTLMWHRDTAKANTGGVYAPAESSYFQYWRDTDGTFHRSKLPGNVGSRPKLFFDANDNAFAVYQLGAISSGGIYINSGSLVIAAATKASNWNDWKVITTEGGGFVSEAQADARLFALTGTLSVVMQNSTTATTTASATAMRALDYTFNITPAANVLATATGNWSAASTWGGTLPAGNANAVINGGRNVSLSSASVSVDGAVIVGTNGTPGTLNLGPDATLIVGGSLVIGRDGGAGGTYNQIGGVATAWRMAVGDYADSTTGGGASTANVSGGSLTVDELQIAMGRGSSGSTFSTGGTAAVRVRGEVLLGDLGNNATLMLNGGTLTVDGDLREGLSGSNSLIFVNGGTLDMTGNSVLADTVNLNTGCVQNVRSINSAAITKNSSGTIAFAGTNTFTQAVTINAGAIRAESNAALGTTTGNTSVSGGTNSGQLQFSGGITVAEPIVLGGRQPVGSAADAPHLNNVAGTNTITGTITTTAGGNQYNVNSDAGKLIVSGNFINNGNGGATDVRTLKLTGAGDGEWQSPIANAAGNAAVTAVTKNDAGTWTLTGANTYTGPTTINGGTLRLGQAAAPNAVATYNFDSVTGSTVNNTGTGGGAMNGALTGGAAIVAGGQSGNAVSLSGGASVNINNTITDLGPASAWTVSAWVKTATAGSSLLTKGNAGWATGNTIFYLGDGSAGGSGGTPSAVRYAGGFFQAAPGTASVTDNAWHLVTYVDNGGAYAIYVDGVAQTLASGNGSFANADVGSVVRLGASTNSVASDGTLNFNGLLDDVRFFNTALSGSQVAGLYGNANYGTLPSATKLTIASGGTLDVNGTVQQVASLNGVSGSAVALGGGRLIVNTADTDTFAGILAGTGGSLVKSGNGTLALTGANTYTGGTTVSGGTLRVAYAAIGTSAATPLLTSAGGTDLQNGRIAFDYTGSATPAATIRTLLAAAYANNFATGQLRSTTATAARGLGYADDGVGGVTVMATLYGDADLDGGVSINDFNALSANFGRASGKVWNDGDFDYDGGVSINDFNLLAAGFAKSASASPSMWAGLLAFAAAHNDIAAFEAVTGVPEPTALTGLGAAATAMLRRRRGDTSRSIINEVA